MTLRSGEMERNTGMKCEVRGVPASSAFIIAFIFIFFAVSAVPIHSTPPTRFLAVCDLSHVTRDITRIKKVQVSISPKKSPWPNAEQAAVLVCILMLMTTPSSFSIFLIV
jgi:hypothetical protein